MRTKGVERLTGEEIKNKCGEYLGFSNDEVVFTLVAETEVISERGRPITLKNIELHIPSLVLWRSATPSIELFSCTLAKTENRKTQNDRTSFHVLQSTIGYFWIEQSTIGNLYIKQSTTRYFSIREQSSTGHFFIDRSTTGDFTIRQQSVTGDLSIRRRSTTDYFLITEQSRTGSFDIDQSTTGDFSINDQSTMDNFVIDQSTTGNFSVEQSTMGYVSIRKRSTIGVLTINNSELAYFGAESSSTDLLINGFYLTKATITQFRLRHCKLPVLRIASGCRIECYIARSSINLIDFQHSTLGKESVISLYDCNVYACLMEEFTVLGSLFFRQSNPVVEPFEWSVPDTEGEKNGYRLVLLQKHKENYEQHKKGLIKGLRVEQSTFRIVQSSLGKTEFTNCDLGGFRLEFNNAKITEMFMSGGTMPQGNIFIHGETEGTLAWHEQKVSVYNQLKKIFDGQGDVYWTTHFHAKTAEHQQRVLKLRHKQESAWFSTTFWDRITFWLNNLSNQHGESWGRALAFTLLAPLLFYLLLLLAGGRLFIPVNLNWQSIWNAIDGDFVGYYFTFLDPTHKIDFLKDKGVQLNGWSSFADFFGWVVVGYGIYQFISAFRKHGRK